MTDDMTPDDPATTPTPTPPLSVGPFDARPTGELRAHLAEITAAGFCVPDWQTRRAAWLRDTLHRAGVELWSHDEATIAHVALWDADMVHVIGAWVLRAATGPGVR